MKAKNIPRTGRRSQPNRGKRKTRSYGKNDRRYIEGAVVQEEETAIVCGQIVKGAVALSSDSKSMTSLSDDKLSSNDIATCMIGRLVDCIPLVGEDEQHKLQLRNAIVRFFTHALNRDWLQLLLLIKELPDVANYGKAASIKLKTADDMSLFQSLCSAYKACSPTSTVETAVEPVINAKADNHK